MARQTSDSNYRRLPKDLAGMLSEQLEAESEFCSLMGSVLAGLLWDLSKCPHIACTLAHKNRVGELIEVTRSAVLCYSVACLRTDEGRPAPEESRLVLSLAGLLTNLTAAAPSILVACGSTFVKDLIKVIPDLPATPLNKILLDLLYNLSLDEAGAAKLLEKDLMKALKKALCSEPDICMSGLKLLASLTSRPLPPMVATLVPVERVKTLYQNGDVEMSYYANMVLNNLISHSDI